MHSFHALALIIAHVGLHFTQAQVFNPFHYGAQGDGTTDDTIAVRATFAAAAANNGGEVLFPKNSTFLTGSTAFLFIGVFGAAKEPPIEKKNVCATGR